MSHKATYWLAKLDPSTVKAGEFRVLFHLCDIHNGDRDPSRACYPSQETLLDRTAMSNGGLNKCLNSLEEGGLLTRRRSTIPGTSTRRTYYILGCDADETTTQTPQSGDSPNSTTVEAASHLTPLSIAPNSTFDGGKLHPSGEEPVKEPVRGTEDTNVSLVQAPQNFAAIAKSNFGDFWDAYPHRHGKKTKRDEAEKAFLKAIKSGATVEQIASGVEALKRDPDTERGYQRGPIPWLNQRGWTDEIPETSQQNTGGYNDRTGPNQTGTSAGRGGSRAHNSLMGAFADVAHRGR